MSTTTVAPANIWLNLRGLLRTMRPQQWTKNGFIYAALIFDGKLFNIGLFLQTTLTAICFCLIASAVYIMNDLVDIEKDRLHPRKRLRPLPSGELQPRIALVAAVTLTLVSLGTALWLDPWIACILTIYLASNAAYSFYLKNIVLIDVMVLSLGFLLRVVAGVEIVQVENFSPWLYVCVTLLALFLGFGKRRHEIALLEGEAASHRPSLEEYNVHLLDQIMGIVTTSMLVAYTFYTFDAETALARDGRMLLTVPFVFYGIVRYLYLIHIKKLGGAPDELLLKDRAMFITMALWVLTVVVLIYAG
jgi:4-hydroxybenzoate polyprenyltransferase